MIKKKMNWRLWIGVGLTGIFLLVAVFGSYFAPYSLDFTEKISYIPTKDGGYLNAPPLPPSLKHWFGTNQWGHDLLTQMLYGAKYTILTTLIVAFFRVGFGGLIGLWLGHTSQKTIKRSPLKMLGSFPAFLIVYFIIFGINFNSTMPSWKLAFIQGGIMALIGVPSIINVTQKKSNELSRELYVEAAKTLGGSSLHIIRQHLFHNLKGEFIILFVNEMILVLSLIGQLGIFNLFLGGTIVQSNPTIYLSKTNEWAGMIGQARQFIYGDQWILVIPLIFFIVALFSFYILSRGLEERQHVLHRKTPYI